MFYQAGLQKWFTHVCLSHPLQNNNLFYKDPPSFSVLYQEKWEWGSLGFRTQLWLLPDLCYYKKLMMFIKKW